MLEIQDELKIKVVFKEFKNSKVKKGKKEIIEDKIPVGEGTSWIGYKELVDELERVFGNHVIQEIKIDININTYPYKVKEASRRIKRSSLLEVTYRIVVNGLPIEHEFKPKWLKGSYMSELVGGLDEYNRVDFKDNFIYDLLKDLEGLIKSDVVDLLNSEDIYRCVGKPKEGLKVVPCVKGRDEEPTYSIVTSRVDLEVLKALLEDKKELEAVSPGAVGIENIEIYSKLVEQCSEGNVYVTGTLITDDDMKEGFTTVEYSDDIQATMKSSAKLAELYDSGTAFVATRLLYGTPNDSYTASIVPVTDKLYGVDNVRDLYNALLNHYTDVTRWMEICKENSGIKLKKERIEETDEERKERLGQLLVDGVEQAFSNPKDYSEWLAFASKVPNYSLKNLMLLMGQMAHDPVKAGLLPVVKTYNQWKEAGEQVRKGSEALYIYAPAMSKIFIDESGKEKKYKEANQAEKAKIKSGEIELEEKPYFYLKGVFHYTDTDIDISKLHKDTMWSSVGNEDELYQEIKNRLIGKGFEIDDTTNLGEKRGFIWNPGKLEIRINGQLNTVQKIKTLLHELSHYELGHLDSKNRQDKNSEELEAESLAFMLCNLLEIDSSDYSFSYLAGYTKDKDINNLLKALEAVKKVYNKVVEAYFTDELPSK